MSTATSQVRLILDEHPTWGPKELSDHLHITPQYAQALMNLLRRGTGRQRAHIIQAVEKFFQVPGDQVFSILLEHYTIESLSKLLTNLPGMPIVSYQVVAHWKNKHLPSPTADNRQQIVRCLNALSVDIPLGLLKSAAHADN